MTPLRKCIRHTAKAKKLQGRADYHAAMARVHLALSEEDEISEFRSAVEEWVMPTYEVDFDELDEE